MAPGDAGADRPRRRTGDGAYFRDHRERIDRPIPSWAWEEFARIVEPTGYRVAEIVGPSRIPELVEIRRTIARALDERGLPPASIGAVLNRERTSILHLLGRTTRNGGAE